MHDGLRSRLLGRELMLRASTISFPVTVGSSSCRVGCSCVVHTQAFYAVLKASAGHGKAS